MENDDLNKSESDNINKIKTILNNDITANENILNNDDDIDDESFHFNWEEDFFKKFDWLDQNSMKETNNKYDLFLDCCNMLQDAFDISKEPGLVKDFHYNKLYMYFISLEDDHMFLHTDFKKTYDEVISNCLNKYDYVKLHNPRNVVFVCEIKDLYDVDKYVKMFMHMFGVENTRGGSYTDIVLEEYLLKTIEYEKKITSMNFYLD